MTLSRRSLLATAFAVAAGSALPGRSVAAGATIGLISAPDGSAVWFDPVGLWVPAGTVVTWVNGADQANTHTTTAYHPTNGHSLRIPVAASPWDSGYLLPGQSFSATLTEEGVYDYFCRPHEMAGMVGRIVVGRSGGPGAQPFDWFKPEHPDWPPVPPDAQRAFPAIEAILRDKVVRGR